MSSTTKVLVHRELRSNSIMACVPQDILLVAMRLGETPVHIPNTMVKP